MPDFSTRSSSFQPFGYARIPSEPGISRFDASGKIPPGTLTLLVLSTPNWEQAMLGLRAQAELSEGRDPARAAAAPKPKRSTERGEGRAKLIAALTKHHQFADDGCLNLEPIGNNELARLVDVWPSTASAFFNDKFQGHAKYKVLCRDAGKLGAALKLLNDEFAPYHLLGAASADLAAPEEGDTDAE